ncbi:unnamed protein product, partial [Adineta steineri]
MGNLGIKVTSVAQYHQLECSIDVDAVGFDEQDLSRLQTPRAKSSGFMKPLINFYRHLQQSLFVRDVYASMFFCDFINMIIVIVFYSQFG